MTRVSKGTAGGSDDSLGAWTTPHNVWIQRPGGEWEFWGGYANEAQALDDQERTQETHPDWEVELRD